jgi:hypothetical protein
MRNYILKIADHDGDELTLQYDSNDWEMTLVASSYDPEEEDETICVMLRQEDVLAMARFALEYDTALRERKRDRDNNIVSIGGIGHD